MKPPWHRPGGERPPEAEPVGETGAGEQPVAESSFAAPVASSAHGAGGDPGGDDARAAPARDEPAEPAPESPSDAPAPEPTPVIPFSQSSLRRPPGTALGAEDEAPDGGPASRPEVLAGAAFAGGLLVAMLIRRVLR